MQVEFEVLEQKITQLVQLSARLRAENHQLRQELAVALSYGKQCDIKISMAQEKLEQLLASIPEDAQ